MKIIKLVDAPRDLRPDVSRIFVAGFYKWLKFFSKDRDRLTRAFTHVFNQNVFYAAVEDDAVLGIAACTDGHTPSVKLNQHELRHHLGFVMGTIAYRVLKKEFEEKPYPFKIEKGMGTIEFVATANKYRGRGVATTLIKELHQQTPFNTYVLEVADNNLPAVKLYEKLGYKVFKKVAEPHSKQSGFDFYLYMKFTQR